MNSRIYLISSRFKSFLLIFAIIIISAVLWYSQSLVQNLRRESRGILEFYTQFYQQAASSDANDEYLNFIFEQIIKRTDFPIILTDKDGNPTGWKGIGIDPMDFSEQALAQVRELADAMRIEAEPVPVRYKDEVINYLVYGDSRSIRQLQLLPYLEIGAVALFILVGFIGFNSIRRSEQQFIWVGMAKETAHQLGTPISSLMGWIELLRLKCSQPAQQEILDDVQLDIDRLNRIAQRFSQIGTATELLPTDINEVIRSVISYFQRRLPQMNRSVELVLHSEYDKPVPLNVDLFEWVLENLIKNALDAIGSNDGKIIIHVAPFDRHDFQVCIDISDDGRGMDVQTRKNIFRPGFSTKKRGWGLGLNLSKRIVEEYHFGKLILRDSQPGKGTTFTIYL